MLGHNIQAPSLKEERFILAPVAVYSQLAPGQRGLVEELLTAGRQEVQRQGWPQEGSRDLVGLARRDLLLPARQASQQQASYDVPVMQSPSKRHTFG